MRTRIAAPLARLAWTAALALALIGAPPTARADEVAPVDDGGDQTEKWSWAKFWDYTGCVVGIVATVDTGGLAWAPTTVICVRALTLYLNE